MSFASKFNKDVKKFEFDTEGLDYVSLNDLFENNGADEVYTLRGFYINKKSKFGDAPVGMTDGCLVNLPSHMLDVVEKIMADDEAVADINAGKVGFTIYSYMDEKHNKICYSIKFVDLKSKTK